MKYSKERQEIIETVLDFNRTGLSEGTSGNLSIRTEDGFLITPTGIEYTAITPSSLVEMDLSGEVISGNTKPSSEWRCHRVVYTGRPEVNAVVHVHSPYATGIACTRRDIPAFHYMIAVAGGDSIRCAEYGTFGSETLAENALLALQDRDACLLANHGQISLGKDIKSAYSLAQTVESLAKQYWISLQVDEPVLLDDEEMAVNLEKFRHYGRQD